jgi:hypothetical protein
MKPEDFEMKVNPIDFFVPPHYISSDVATQTTTYMDYDIARIAEQYQQLGIGFALMVFLHFQYGYLRPLVLQSVLGFRTLATAPLFQIYIFGKEPTGELKRPFKKGFME